MAISNKVTFICEVCGEMSKTYDTWQDTNAACQREGWMVLKMSNGWHHFCKTDAQEIADFIAKLKKSPTPVIASHAMVTVKPKKKKRNAAKALKRRAVHIERLKLFAHQSKDHYEELAYDDFVFVKYFNKAGGKWEVAKYTTESFAKFKNYKDERQAEKLHYVLDKELANRIASEP